MKKIAFLLFFISILQLDIAAQSVSAPIKLKYGLYLKRLVPNFKENKFYAEFYWWTSFRNDSLVTGFSNDEIMNLQYVNGSETPANAIAEEIQEQRDLGDGNFYCSGFHQGYFFFDPEFRSYPFDKQKLLIEIEHTLLLQNQVEIEPDIKSYKFSNMSPGTYGLSAELFNNSSSGMKIRNSDIMSGSSVYNSNFGDPDFPAESKYSRLTYSICLDRVVEPYITKLFIPLAIILFLVYFVFFIPPDKLDMAAGLTVTSLLSAIAFQFTINSDLPEIGYLIYVDKVFYLTYAFISFAMGESLYTFYLDSSENERKKTLAIKIDVISRFAFPLLFALGCLLLNP